MGEPGSNLVEAMVEGPALPLHRLQQEVLHIQVDILLLVGLRDCYISPARHKIHGYSPLAKVALMLYLRPDIPRCQALCSPSLPV